MKKSYLIVLLVFLVLPCITFAKSFQNVYFLWQGTYAIDPYSKEGRKISTYLPPTTLVFKKDTENRKINDIEYALVTTQHGNDLWVVSNTISKRSYKEVYGDQAIIFHQNKYICPQDNKNCSEGVDINRGDVLELIETSDYVHLRKTIKISDTERVVDGYLPLSRYNKFRKTGILTDAGKKYPKYILKSAYNIESLSTNCGQIKKEIDMTALSAEVKEVVSPFGFIPWLKDVFSIEASASVKDENQKIVEMAYGFKDKAIEYYRIVVGVPDDSGTFNKKRIFNIVSTIKCLELVGQKIYIENVVINENGQIVGMLSFDTINGNEYSNFNLNERSGPFKIYISNGGRPFLTSINSIAHYENVLDHWVNQIRDVSLANILMPIFNASCPRKDEDMVPVREECAKIIPVP